MKKTLAIVLALAVALTLGVIAFAEDISEVLSSAPAEVEETTEADEAIEVIPAEEAPVEEAPGEDVPAEEVPAEEAPAEEAPVEDVPAEEAPKAKPAQTDEQEYTPEEIALMRAVLGNRGQSWYSSVDLDEYGNEYETYNFELSEEIAEKYGTRDSRLLPHIMVFQNFGDLDYSETFEMCYGIVEPYSGKIPVVEQIETYTVEIPAHGIAFVVLENKGDYPNSFSRLVSATYGDLSFELSIDD